MRQGPGSIEGRELRARLAEERNAEEMARDRRTSRMFESITRRSGHVKLATLALFSDRMFETLLLPGMDGTGELLASFARHLAPELSPRIVNYPLQRALGYVDLERGIGLPDGPFAIVAESFSGPICVRLTARHPDRVRGVVLVASFVRSPAPILARLGALIAPLLGGTAPAFALRWWLLGGDATKSEIGRASCRERV